MSLSKQICLFTVLIISLISLTSDAINFSFSPKRSLMNNSCRQPFIKEEYHNRHKNHCCRERLDLRTERSSATTIKATFKNHSWLWSDKFHVKKRTNNNKSLLESGDLFCFLSPSSISSHSTKMIRKKMHNNITKNTLFTEKQKGGGYYHKNKDLITLMSSISFPNFENIKGKSKIDMIGSFVKWRSPSGDPDPAEVDVLIETPSSGVRRISASIVIERSIEDVWSILTDYDNLSTYVPNLTESKLVPNENGQVAVTDGKCRLYQEGAQTIAGFKFGASLTMDMQEVLEREDSALGGRKIKFTLVDSAMFNDFSGEWRLQFYSRKKKTNSEEWQYFTKLFYMVTIRPRGPVPVLALEWRIREDVPINLRAVKKSSEALGESGKRLSFTEEDKIHLNELNQAREKQITSLTDSWETDETLEAYIDKLNQQSNQ